MMVAGKQQACRKGENMHPTHFPETRDLYTARCYRCGAAGYFRMNEEEGRYWFEASEHPDDASHFPCQMGLGEHARQYRLFEPDTMKKLDFYAVSLNHAQEIAERWLERAFGLADDYRHIAYVTELRAGMPWGTPTVAYQPLPPQPSEPHER
jgi:hypothetical protein